MVERKGEEIELIHSWSTPRSLSTSLLYSFAQRDDMEVLDEPLYPNFLRITGVERPYREELLSKMESDGNKVVNEIILGPGQKKYRFCKIFCVASALHFSKLSTRFTATAGDPNKLVSEHSVLGRMATKFSKEMEEESAITSDEEKQLEDRVNKLEAKMDVLQSEFKAGKSEIKKAMSIMMEKFNLMMKKWDVQERERKEKGVSSTSSEPTLQSDAPLKGFEAGEYRDTSAQGTARLENRGSLTGDFVVERLKSLSAITAPLPTLTRLLSQGLSHVQAQGLGLIREQAQGLEGRNELVKQAHLANSPNRNKNNSLSPNSFNDPLLYPYAHLNISTHSIQIIHPKTNVITMLQPPKMTREIPLASSTGYGICMDNILILGGRLTTRVNSYSKLTPNLVLKFEVEIYFHLEDKVDFGRRVLIDPQSHSCSQIIHIPEGSLVSY